MSKSFWFCFLMAACLLPACKSEKLIADTSQPPLVDSLFDDDVAMPPAPEEPVYTIVERMPVFPGCDTTDVQQVKTCTEASVVRYFQKHQRYPRQAIDQGIQGTVFVQYDIDETGKVAGVSVLRGVHELLDSAAMDLVKSLPVHLPGRQRGKAVRVRYTVPIRFTLK